MKGHHPGTTWRKADLQCHTARDFSWRGETQLPGTTPDEVAAREAWADSFIAACVAKGVHVVAITDHHDLCMVEYIERAAARDGGRVLVFPGVEVTCSDNAQCLAIIDPSASLQLRARFLSFRNFTACAPEAGRTPQAGPVGLTVTDLFKMILSDSELRDNSVVMPHFSDGNAHKHINVNRNHLRFADLECDGVYIDKPFSDLQPDTIKKVYGEVPDWGTRRRGIIPTGDNRYEDWGRLGKHECWLKLGENTIEALRQALLADEARIAYSAPSAPAEKLISLTVVSDLTGGQPLSMSFNAGFTAIIGGRGSGKSSILEYLRFALARTVSDFPHGEVVSSGGKEQNLIDETLGDGFVEVVVDRGGLRETWRREWNSKDHIVVTDASGTATPITIGDAQRKFRARAFYQKGLSTTVNDPASAADQITGIAAAEVLEKRRSIEQEIEKAQLAVRNALGQVTAHWLDKLELRQARGEVDDVARRVLAVALRLDEQGVSSEAKEVMAKAPIYARARSWLVELESRVTETYVDVDALRQGLLTTKTDVAAAVNSFEEMSELSVAIRKAQQHILAQLDQAAKVLSDLEGTRKGVEARFETRSAEFDKKHKAALAAQSAHSALIEESAVLMREQEAAAVKHAAASVAVEKSELAPSLLVAARDELQRLVESRRELLREAADHVGGKSSERLEASVKRDPEPAEYIDAFMRLLQGSHVLDAESKCRAWIKTVVKADAEAGWWKIVDAVLRAYEAKIEAGSPSEPSPDSATALKEIFFGGGNLTPAQTRKIYGSLDDSTLGALLAAAPRDYISMRYVDDQGRKKPFGKASPGQQASALLELLLQQSAGPLIIDQPEDDLDNRVVMKIVNLIKTSKNQRQLIFTTHNPNVVVNGDADKVIALETNDLPATPGVDVPEITIDVDGAIETTEIRHAVTRIMEGGKEAFELRRRKYRFDRAA